MAEVTVILRNVRTAPRKIRQVIDLVRGLDVNTARDQLLFSVRRAAGPVRKLLLSGVAASKERNLDQASLSIAMIRCDQGAALRRYRYRSRGRATPVKKFTSHVTLTLTDTARRSAPVRSVKSRISPKPNKKTS